MSLTLTAVRDGDGQSSQVARELTAEHRPGRRFEPTLERALDDDLITLATRLPGSAQGLVVAREFPGGRGVADVVALTRWQDGYERRIATQAPFLRNQTDCSIVAAMSPRQTLTVPSLSKRLGMSPAQVVRRVRGLVSTGHVERSGSGFRRVQGLDPIGRTYALEAKVSDWRKGVSQALRYATWCDAAALVLLRPPRNLAETEATCAALGLGLAVGDRWAIRPRLARPNAGLRLAASEQWARLLSESESL